jgi:hypothetical protein
MGFRDEVSAAIASVGGEGVAAVDAIADPGGAARALEGDRVVLRLAPELGGAIAAFGPEPIDPVWASLTRGSREVKTAPLRGGAIAIREARGVQIDSTPIGCCGAPACAVDKTHVEVWLMLSGKGPGRLLVAEQRSIEPFAAVRAIADRLARLLGVPLGPAYVDPTAASRLPEPLPALPAEDLARLALRSEGGRVVLRSFESLGPRATAGRNTAIGAAAMLAAAALFVELFLALRAGSTGTAAAFGAGGALLGLTGYAFLGVARFSARYRATSAALFAAGRDQMIVLPWVGRSGAVDTRPEGRLGAAIPLGEVREAMPQARDGRWAIELDTDHGNMDAIEGASEAEARYWADALHRVMGEARHPNAQTSARQRARAKAKDEPAHGAGS